VFGDVTNHHHEFTLVSIHVRNRFHIILTMKIYIPLEGAMQEKTFVDFQSESVHLKIYDVNDKNY